MASPKSLLLALLLLGTLGTFCAGALGRRIVQAVPVASLACNATGGTWPGPTEGEVVVQYMCTATVQNNLGTAVCIQFNCGSIDPAALCSATNSDCIYGGQLSASCATPWPVWNQGPMVFTLQSSKGDPGISITAVTPGEKCA